MSQKLKCYWNWYIVKPKMSTKLRYHQKLKCQNNWNVTKTEMSLNLECHKKWKIAKTANSLKIKCYKTDFSPKLKCNQNVNVAKTKMSQNMDCSTGLSNLTPEVGHCTAVQLVFIPFSQFIPQLELYSQLQLSL